MNFKFLKLNFLIFSIQFNVGCILFGIFTNYLMLNALFGISTNYLMTLIKKFMEIYNGL